MTGPEDTPPLTGADLEAWTAALPQESRAAALLLAGLDLAELGAFDSAWKLLRSGVHDSSLGVATPGFLTWDFGRHRLAGSPVVDVPESIALLPRHFDAEIPVGKQPPPLRLAVTGNVIPPEVVSRLLTLPGVGSAVIPAHSPPGALRHRSWHWPLRVGVADDALVAAFGARRDGGGLPPTMAEVTDVRVDAGGVDLLVLRAGPKDAAVAVARRRQLAGVVVCVGHAAGTWPVVDAHLALVRAATGAIGSVSTPPDDAEGIVRHVLRALRCIANGHPIDVSLTAGFERSLLLVGQTEALAESSLPQTLKRRRRQLRRDFDVMMAGAEPPELASQEQARADLEIALPRALESPSLHVRRAPITLGVGEWESPGWQTRPSRGDVDGESADDLRHEWDRESSAAEPTTGRVEDSVTPGVEASVGTEAQQKVEAALDAAAVSRFLQARVGPVESGPTAQNNMLRPGPNAVDIFIGPQEAGALLGPAAPDELLGLDDPAINRVRLTVVLVPLIPLGEPVRTEVDVPRVGRSPDARLIWNLPGSRGKVQARIMVLHRNRVIQTAVLGGRVGSAARLTERLILWDKLNHLDDRRPFARTFVLNHDDAGVPAVISHADGTTTIEAMTEVDAITERIRRYLLTATQTRSPKGPAAKEAMRKILIDVAEAGNDLFGVLEDYLGELGNLVAGDRIQIVTARSGRFLPLELVYSQPAPDLDAVLCPNWEAGRQCGPQCFADQAGGEAPMIVCPAVFWGMSMVIERHHTSLTDASRTAFLVSANPTRERSRLHITGGLLAASKKVKPADVQLTAAALPSGTAQVCSLKAWRAALKATPATDLLVLMPHTDPATKTLEISGEKLSNGRIESWYVTGGQEVSPVVMLFGCDTGGSAEDPAGYATRFMARGAAVVFSTLTMLLASHAAAMSQQLAALLQDPARPEQPLGEVVTAFRREAVRGGLVSALSVTAYGDADWKV